MFKGANKIWIKISTATAFFLIFAFHAQAQTYTISGYISDGSNREILIGATATETGSGKGAATNSYGFYSLTLPNRLFMNGNLSYNRYLYGTSIDKRYDFTDEDGKRQRGGSRLDYD